MAADRQHPAPHTENRKTLKSNKFISSRALRSYSRLSAMMASIIWSRFRSRNKEGCWPACGVWADWGLGKRIVWNCVAGEEPRCADPDPGRPWVRAEPCRSWPAEASFARRRGEPRAVGSSRGADPDDRPTSSRAAVQSEWASFSVVDMFAPGQRLRQESLARRQLSVNSTTVTNQLCSLDSCVKDMLGPPSIARSLHGDWDLGVEF